MTNVLDRILEFHDDPKLLVVTDKPLTDTELNIPILAKYLQEDADSWFIKHEGRYIAYCSKKAKEMSEKERQDQLRNVLAEVWGRYTNKKMNDGVYLGFDA